MNFAAIVTIDDEIFYVWYIVSLTFLKLKWYKCNAHRLFACRVVIGKTYEHATGHSYLKIYDELWTRFIKHVSRMKVSSNVRYEERKKQKPCDPAWTFIT